MPTISVYCKNTGTRMDVPKGASLETVWQMTGLTMEYGPTNCLVNNCSEGLHRTLDETCDLEFQNVTTQSGHRTYIRSLFFVLYKAVHDLYPHLRLRIGMPVSGGYYCALSGDKDFVLTDETVGAIRQRMQAIIEADILFRRKTCYTSEAVELFRNQGLKQKAKLLEHSPRLYTNYYILPEIGDAVDAGKGQTADFFYGALLTHTGQIHIFDVVPYNEGILLRIPDIQDPAQLRPMKDQQKMYEAFQEERRWQDILGISTVGELNRALLAPSNGVGAASSFSDIVNVSEALQEKKIGRIADTIAGNPKIRMVLIAGPSSSGKTTFAGRLCVHLRACGKRPFQISLDDYFVDRERSPRNAKGDYDFEHIESLNLPLFNQQMNQLLAGEEVELPRYDFPSGKSVPSGRRLRLTDDIILVMEGNHALNPRMSEALPDEVKFKIYASALTTIMLDDHNYIPTTDNRLLRRICRDYKYRGVQPQEVIRRCASVSAGEEKWIFPFQEEADVMINTSLLYEIAALRGQALPLLESVPESAPEYATAHRLRLFLGYFIHLPLNLVPANSLLREFMGS